MLYKIINPTGQRRAYLRGGPGEYGEVELLKGSAVLYLNEIKNDPYCTCNVPCTRFAKVLAVDRVGWVGTDFLDGFDPNSVQNNT